MTDEQVEKITNAIELIDIPDNYDKLDKTNDLLEQILKRLSAIERLISDNAE